MRIRKTTLNDLEPVMAMYDYARKFMQEPYGLSEGSGETL